MHPSPAQLSSVGAIRFFSSFMSDESKVLAGSDKVFDAFDADKSGAMNAAELGAALSVRFSAKSKPRQTLPFQFFGQQDSSRSRDP